MDTGNKKSTLDGLGVCVWVGAGGSYEDLLRYGMRIHVLSIAP